MKAKVLVGIYLLLSMVSCYSRYQKEEGKWVWVSNHPDTGKRTTHLGNHDLESFAVLENGKYARDNQSVFYIGKTIEEADPNSFEVINDNGYSRDDNHVYFEDEKIIFANPTTFQYLEFPYSKDDNHIFCGTLPMNLSKKEVTEFKVTNTDQLMTGSKSRIKLSHFIRLHPEYKWLDILDIAHITLGEWGTGETSERKFKGFREIPQE